MSPLEKPDGFTSLPPLTVGQQTMLGLKKIKGKLPLNGDWLYVSEIYLPPTLCDSEASLGEETWDTPDKIFQELNSSDLQIIKLIYERAKAYESMINAKADHVRDKAKSLLGTVSFVSAALFGITTFLTTSIVKLDGWWFTCELVLLGIFAAHLFRALLLAMNVMMREVVITSRQEELLLQKSATELHALKCLSAQIFAYANRTDEFVRERVNKLILGQAAFQYGIIWFSLLLIVQICAGKKINEMETRAKSAILNQAEIQSSVLSREQQLSEELKHLKIEIDRIRQDNASFIKQLEMGQNTAENKELKNNSGPALPNKQVVR